MRLIGIATAAGAASLCLALDGSERVWEGGERVGPRRLIAGVRELMADAGVAASALDAIAFDRGPGAFTGVRLAVALAQGMGLGADRPLVAVSDLAALAWRAHRKYGCERVLACMDARRGEVYWGAYEVHAEAIRPVLPECVGPPGTVPVAAGEWFVAGTGLPLLGECGYAGAGDPSVLPDARAVAALAAAAFSRDGGVAAALAEPVYLRDRVATASPRRHNPALT